MADPVQILGDIRQGVSDLPERLSAVLARRPGPLDRTGPGEGAAAGRPAGGDLAGAMGRLVPGLGQWIRIGRDIDTLVSSIRALFPSARPAATTAPGFPAPPPPILSAAPAPMRPPVGDKPFGVIPGIGPQAGLPPKPFGVMPPIASAAGLPGGTASDKPFGVIPGIGPQAGLQPKPFGVLPLIASAAGLPGGSSTLAAAPMGGTAGHELEGVLRETVGELRRLRDAIEKENQDEAGDGASVGERNLGEARQGGGMASEGGGRSPDMDILLKGLRPKEERSSVPPGGFRQQRNVPSAEQAKQGDSGGVDIGAIIGLLAKVAGS